MGTFPSFNSSVQTFRCHLHRTLGMWDDQRASEYIITVYYSDNFIFYSLSPQALSLPPSLPLSHAWGKWLVSVYILPCPPLSPQALSLPLSLSHAWGKWLVSVYICIYYLAPLSLSAGSLPPFLPPSLSHVWGKWLISVYILPCPPPLSLSLSSPQALSLPPSSCLR